MPALSRRRALPALLALLAPLAVTLTVSTATATPAAAQSYVPISGAGSTWSQNAVDQWRRNVNQFGMRVNYAGTGSSDGRNQFRNGTVDFAVSEIPYGLRDGNAVDTPPQRGFAYMPIVAGGTAFMYNLKIGGQRVTNLRLSGEVIAAIFTGGITSWDDARIAADNPGLTLPARKIVPVVRSDGSGTTAQFTTWLSKKHAGAWDPYCAKAGRPTPCGSTSQYPVVPGSGFTAQSGSLGVSGYVAQNQNEGAITYVEYSYALNTGFPVAKMLNANGFYVEPKASNVAVGLLGARINEDRNSPQYLTQDLSGVYDNGDARAYPLSSYSYIVVPTAADGTFNNEKGRTLGAFAYYFLCEGQQQADSLGYSPLPINLVQAGLDVVQRIPGVAARRSTSASATTRPSPPAARTRWPRTRRSRPPVTRRAPGSAASAPVAPRRRRRSSRQRRRGSGGGTAAAAGAATGTTAGGAPGTPGAAGGAAGGADAALGTSEAALALEGDPSLLDPSALEGTVDPLVAGGQGITAVPLSLAARDGWQMQNTLTLVAIALLLALVVGPPLAWRRLAGRTTDGGAA
jgi:phosphate ABC transporter phosphate-binding protein